MNYGLNEGKKAMMNKRTQYNYGMTDKCLLRQQICGGISIPFIVRYFTTHKLGTI